MSLDGSLEHSDWFDPAQETGDPDDVLTLLLLCAWHNITLELVAVTGEHYLGAQWWLVMWQLFLVRGSKLN